MMMAKTHKIETPVKGFTGEVVGVVFDNGVGETEDERALAYFRRHGYTIDGKAPERSEPARQTADGPERVGAALRDAAVKPRDTDFLPPTNAGKADPHGPDVVSPEVHASQGVRPVTGGTVHVEDPAAQEANETAAVVARHHGGEGDGDERPAGNASRDAWHTYALAQGKTADELDGLSRNDIRDLFTDQ